MKKTLFLLLFIACGKISGQKSYQAPSVEAVQQKLASLAPHPRLLLPEKKVAVLKTQLQKEPLRRDLHEAILVSCDKMLGVPPVERIQIGKRLLDKSRECLRRVFQLSYAYRMTGEEKYLKRAEKELLAVSAFSDWNPSHFLDVAEMTLAVAIGYDWLYNGLPEKTRKTLRDAILELGIEPSFEKKFNNFLQAENNWNQVCNAGMVWGALAVAEDQPELSAKVIQRAAETLPRSMRHYAPDGGYPEGFGYWDYGTTFNVLLLSACETALGTDFGLSELPGFMRSGEFPLHMVGPLLQAHNWGDSGLKAGLTPAMFWYASRLKDPSLLWTEKKILQKRDKGDIQNRLLPALLIWGSELDMGAVRPPRERVWIGQGDSPVGLMRTSWTDRKAIFVGFKAGAASVNHGHMDVGSFVLDALGERWAMDFGMQNYHSLESKGIKLWGRNQQSQRWQIYRYNNHVHNTLTLNDALHNADGYAKIDRWSGDSAAMFVVSDLSEVFKGQADKVERGVVVRNNREVVVRDEIRAGSSPVAVRWNMLTAAKVELVDKKTVKLSRNGRHLWLHFESDTDLSIKTWNTNPPHDYDAPNPGSRRVGFEALVPAGQTGFFNAVFTVGKTDKAAAIAPLAEWKGR